MVLPRGAVRMGRGVAGAGGAGVAAESAVGSARVEPGSFDTCWSIGGKTKGDAAGPGHAASWAAGDKPLEFV